MTYQRLIIIACAALLLAACQPAPETELSGAIQGTTYHIKMVLDGLDVQPEQIRGDVEAVFKDVDEKLSNWRADSEISRLNRETSTDWLPASAEIVQLASLAQAVHRKTAGCYDLTVKPLIDLWGFSKHENHVPSDAEIKAVLTHLGMDKLEVDAANYRLRKRDPLLQIDLGSVAQGYTVGAVAARLEARGIGNYLAEIGGEMKVRGKKANGAPWRVAIEKPLPMVREVQRVLDLHEERGVAVMTSGTYRNFFESGGKRYSHILDPRTGKPVDHAELSATVLHPDPTIADIWSTALLCVGETEARRLADQEGLAALLIHHEGDQLKEVMSEAFLKSPDSQAESANKKETASGP